jgi:flagellar assembly protein FliH
MIRRMEVNGSPLAPWQFPELNGAARRGAVPSAPETDGSREAAGEADNTRSMGPNGKNADDPHGDLVAAAVAKGHAEGFERGLAEGRKKGYAAGLAAGQEAAQRSLAEEAQRLNALVQRLLEPIPALERTVEEAAVALALEIARCVIGSEVARSREPLIRLIREAIAKVPIETGALEVVLNPADLDLVRALAPEIEQGSARLLGDPAVEAGGCLVIGHGEVKDVRWHPRLREGLSQVDLSLAARWRNVMLTLFDGEDEE